MKAGGAITERAVALLFSDIVGSTAHVERVGDRAWHALIGEHEALTRELAAAHGGEVVKHLGDGFMLAFGSVRAAIACAERLRAAAGELRLRIGIHVGEPVARDGDYFGRDVALAARIAAAAAEGEILVSADARRMAEGSGEITFGSVRSAPLKGFEGLVELHPLSDGAGTPAVPAPPAGDLLERASEVTVLSRGLSRAVGGAGSTVFIEGAPGIGKTTLLRRAREMAAAAGARVLGARGAELDTGLAFGVLRQLLVPEVRRDEGLLAGPAAAARAALGMGEGGAPVDDAAVAHAVYWIVSDLAAAGPLVFLVDDLQWADPASRRALVQVCGRLTDLPVLAVLGTRPDPAVATEFDAVLRDPDAVEVCPAPLSPAAVEALAAARTGQPVDGGFAAACHEVSGGVPFLVHELLREIADGGIAPAAESVEQVRRLAPRAIQRSVLVRLAQLSPAAHAVARAVAVEPRPSSPALAAELAGLDLDECVEAVGRLVAAHVLDAAAELEFVHPIMRSAVYEDIPPVERGRAHALAAAVLRRRGAEAEQVAGHLLLADPAGDADCARLLHATGRAALQAGAADAAVRYLDRAVAEPPHPDELSAVLADLGRALGAAGRPSVERLRQAHDAATGADERAALAPDLAEALAFEADDPAPAMAVLWQSIDELPERDERRLRLFANLYVLSDRFTETLADQERALRLMPRDLPGDTPGERALITILTHDAMISGTLQQRDALILPILEKGDIVADEPAGSAIANYAISGHRISGRLELADAMAARVIEKARLSGRRGSTAWAMVLRAGILFRRGRLVDAEAEASLAMELLVTDGHHTVLPVTGWLARILVERGKLDEAGALVDGVEIPVAQAGYYVAVAQAAVAAARGEIERAAELQLRARDLCAPWTNLNPANDEWGHEAAVLLAAAGRGDEARELLEGRLARAVEFGEPAAIARLLAARGVVEGDPDPVREAVGMLAATEHGLAHMKAVVDLGAVLRRRGQDREAREHLRAGLALARDAGALLIAGRAEDELRAAGGKAVSRALTGAESLTPSELRVASLAAEGVSNREIAQRLFLTVKTVEMHLGSSYRKLDIKGRRELPAALAG